MTVVVITPPEPVVTFAEVERHLGDVPAEDQSYVEGLIAAATAWIDGPAGWLGRAFGAQLLEWRLGAWPCANWRWPILPFLEADTISYVDPDGATITEDGFGLLEIINPPSVRGRTGDIRIRYWAGYGKRDQADPEKWINATPPPVKVAIMMLVAQWYNTRENAVVGGAPATMPFAVDALLSPYRIWRL